MALELDPRFTFEAFVVGPGNRLAVAAARRVSDTPGTTYNPLFMYSGSGLGKTHLLGAIGSQVQRVHDADVVYETLEHLMEQVSEAVGAGELEDTRRRLRAAGILLIDDVQFLAGQRQIQEELLRAWDALAGRGAQVVLSSDRPPHEIDGLDDRLGVGDLERRGLRRADRLHDRLPHPLDVRLPDSGGRDHRAPKMTGEMVDIDIEQAVEALVRERVFAEDAAAALMLDGDLMALDSGEWAVRLELATSAGDQLALRELKLEPETSCSAAMASPVE